MRERKDEPSLALMRDDGKIACSTQDPCFSREKLLAADRGPAAAACICLCVRARVQTQPTLSTSVPGHLCGKREGGGLIPVDQFASVRSSS
jgi:hypothetical protein